jgi:di/tricarboxylate transporter
MWQQTFVFLVITTALAFFAWGRYRYDFVALSAITVLTIAGVLEPTEVFHGFGNDAVLSVIAILVVGRALRVAGITEPFAALLLRLGRRGPVEMMALTTGTVTFFSGFMNNTGALAVFLPVAVHVARAVHRLASSMLMPLAFASLLGGLITLIGTPPNILVSAYREDHLGEPFGMFDYTPVGLGLAVAGVLFLSFVGWRLIPPRRGSVSPSRLLRMQTYFAEVRVPPGSPLAGGTLRDLERLDVDANIVGLVRGKQRIVAPPAYEVLEEGDTLLVEAGSADMSHFLDQAGLERGQHRTIAVEDFRSRDVALQEIVVGQGSMLQGRTAKGLRMRWRYGMNILAISRRGERISRRLADVRLKAGDVLLIQARREGLEDALRELKCYTLMDHEHPRPSMPKLLFTVVVFAAAMTSVVLDLLSLGFAFLSAALLLVMGRVVTMRQAYTAVDWPVVVLLAATIPLGTALEKTGGAETIAQAMISMSGWLPAAGMVGLLMVVTMLLSNVINNAATAVLMAPIAFRLATDLSVSPDTFLMAVAVGASSCFLTPIGHQCNILVLGPGGYHFNDYARVGVPLSLLVVVLGLPLILMVWPLR